ncbi:protein-disulfide reductase DsbD [Uliginosibacterium sediminicola]|uniref:Protein-disulfide reductase DsbD n=1 Tax=Uliginosibacterium sediminicola TaxID=2024550 RepID=A0ABU9YUQ0_9RHOO
MLLIRALLVLCLFAHSAILLADEEPLPPDQAFRLAAANLLDTHEVQLQLQVAPGYYLYRDKFEFRLDPGGPLAGSAARYPQGEIHEDRFFGKQTIFKNRFTIALPVPATTDEHSQLFLTVQGCSEKLGVCYPPFEIAATLKAASMSLAPGASGGSLLGTLGGQPAALIETPESRIAMPGELIPAEDSRIAGLLGSGKLLAIVGSFFGFGLLLAFTPCVLPMLPILSGIIVGKGATISRARALLLSCAYVLGMALTYTAAGIAAGYTGAALSTWLQNAWVLAALALLFVLLALPMFGLFELQLPSSLQSRLAAFANRQGSSLGGLALMGAISALVVGPCMTAPLAGALLSIAQSGDARIGGIALFALAIGMGTPLILIGVLARHWLPRPGPWMDGVKAFFGWLLLATALWLLYPVLPPGLFSALAVLMLAVPALLLWLRSRRMQTPAYRLTRLTAVLLLLGALGLGSWQLSQHQARSQVAALPFAAIHTIAELDQALARSTQPVLLDFYADWCVSCREMEHYTLRDPAVRERLAGFTLLRVDVTANTPDDQALLKRFALYAPPAMLFFKGGQAAGRVIGYKDAEDFAALLDRIHSGNTP